MFAQARRLKGIIKQKDKLIRSRKERLKAKEVEIDRMLMQQQQVRFCELQMPEQESAKMSVSSLNLIEMYDILLNSRKALQGAVHRAEGIGMNY